MIKGQSITKFAVTAAFALNSHLALADDAISDDLALTRGEQALAVEAPSFATTCKNVRVSLGYFNGVLTSYSQAEIDLVYLEQLYGASNSSGEQIEYEVYYNYTRGFEDFVETFDQRLNEQEPMLKGRFELFYESLEGGGQYSDEILGVISSFQQFKTAFDNYVKDKLITILGELVAKPPMISEYIDHRKQVDTQIDAGNKILFSAHSQGNLFANAAFDYATTKASQGSVKIVHVAPASPTTRGPHTLADLDLVINALRLTGTVPNITDSISGYALRPAGLDGQKDIKGHGLFSIYLNPAISTSQRINGHVTEALNSLKTTEKVAFTITLRWDGAGDLDLHVFEPTNTHVYFDNKKGDADLLDVNSTIADGPERYSASCDLNKLKVGEYKYGFTHKAGAEGRWAILEVLNGDGSFIQRSRTRIVSNLFHPEGQVVPRVLQPLRVRRNSTTGEFEFY